MKEDNFKKLTAQLSPNHTHITGELIDGEYKVDLSAGEKFQFIIDSNDGFKSNVGIAFGNKWLRRCFVDSEDFIIGLPHELASPLDTIANYANPTTNAEIMSVMDDLVHQANLMHLARMCYDDNKRLGFINKEDLKSEKLN